MVFMVFNGVGNPYQPTTIWCNGMIIVECGHDWRKNLGIEASKKSYQGWWLRFCKNHPLWLLIIASHRPIRWITMSCGPVLVVEPMINRRSLPPPFSVVYPIHSRPTNNSWVLTLAAWQWPRLIAAGPTPKNQPGHNSSNKFVVKRWSFPPSIRALLHLTGWPVRIPH